jgi:hypothetical protein
MEGGRGEAIVVDAPDHARADVSMSSPGGDRETSSFQTEIFCGEEFLCGENWTSGRGPSLAFLTYFVPDSRQSDNRRNPENSTFEISKFKL